MKFDHKLTKEIGEWLRTTAAQRDLEAGNILLLTITSNSIQYNNIRRKRDFATLEYQLQKHYNFRVADLTEEQLAAMVDDSSQKMAEIGITEKPESVETPTDAKGNAVRFGRRKDHNSLPEDIQNLYKQTLQYRHQMQQLHLQIRTMLKTKTKCTASDIYAFVKELLVVEKKYSKAWQRYDEYTSEL